MRKNLCKQISTYLLCLLALSVAFSAQCRSASAITIDFDYSYDTTGFFSSQARRDVLEEAANSFEPFWDTLSAIVPSGNNTWNAVIKNPATGSQTSISNLSISTNHIRIYVGARNLSGSTLGSAGPGGWGASGSTSWLNSVGGRGQGNGTLDAVRNPQGGGSTAYEFGPWGGAIAFDTLTDAGQLRNWHDGIQTLPSSGQSDLLSIALHELAHVFGFGTSDSYSNKIVGSTFTGTEATGLYGSSPPVTTGKGHWDYGTMDPIINEAPVMVPSITTGTRRAVAPLDYAALADIGWLVPDELINPVTDTADFDNDGDVDGSDFLAWQTGFGTTSGATLAQGDSDYDGDVDADDFAFWKSKFGQASPGSGSLSGGSTNVPEPSSCIVLLICSLLGLRFAKWMRSK